jgi:hypothetical protein
LPLKAGARAGSSLSRRRNSRLTPVGSHLPSNAAGISCSFNSLAMALAETKPALRSFRIVEAKALARASAACLCACPLLILPFVIRPRRASTLFTVVRCQSPPRAVAFLFRSVHAPAHVGHEPCRHKIPNSRDQSMRVGIRGPPTHHDPRACGMTFPCVLAPLSHHGRAMPRRLMLNLCRGLLEH